MMPRIMKRRSDLFASDRKLKKLIANRMGWVDVASSMKQNVRAIERFGERALRDGLKHVVLMGMGGSSLCPEVFGLIFGKHPKLKSFQIIDSTDPVAIKTVRRKIEIKKTLFIVASKSGGKVETRSHEAFFLGELRKAGVRNIGRHFAAITDSGSDLHKSANNSRYRKIFLNPSDIGGRYSALSYFGLAPAFFAGVDLRRLLDEAIILERLLSDRSDETNPGTQLGAILAGAAKAGMDKMTVIASKKMAPFVPWVEQLVAESTGKKGRGIIPVEGEPLGKAAQYGKDRLFLFIRIAGEKTNLSARFLNTLAANKTPLVEIVLGDKTELGSQFLLWEAATAVAGRLLGINPFDEPNVTESKNNTKEILSKFRVTGAFPETTPIATWGKLSLLSVGGKKRFTKADRANLTSFLTKFFRGLRPPGYLSLLCYFRADRRIETALSRIREKIRNKTGTAILRGFGPRYLHSLGQLYKGGPTTGAFVVFVRSRYGKLEIPDQFFDFGQLIEAQASGDARALIERDLPTLVIAVDGDPASALETFARAAGRALK